MSAFRWVVDEDGDIGIEVLRMVTLIKYKHSTLIVFGWKTYRDAPKRIHENCREVEP